jgi:geranylgeranyl diphosphate synthase, type I
MSLTLLQQDLIPKIETFLINTIDSLEFGSSQVLKKMIRYHLGWEDNPGDSNTKGKRIRPFLALLCGGAFGGDSTIEKTLPAAAAIELLHNFTLIHDDIEDSSPSRHGRPTLWKHWGVAQAINAGDALFSIAQISMLGLSKTTDDQTAVTASIRFNQVCLHLTRGQYLDIDFEDRQLVDTETYLMMINGKTAALIGLSTWIGGLAAGQNENTLNKLYDFGVNLGLAFQMLDDFLGIWGDPEIIGKSTASDLVAQKKTLPILYGLTHCPEFRHLWQKPPYSEKILKQMSELLEDCGAKSYVKELAEKHTRVAFDHLEGIFPHDNAYTEALSELSKNLLHRSS